ncbi:MAG: cellulase family glycosylhydrolase [bacterium]
MTARIWFVLPCLVLAACAGSGPAATPTATATAPPTPSATPTSSASASASASATATTTAVDTATPPPTASQTPSSSPTPSASPPPSSTQTPVDSPTPSATPTRDPLRLPALRGAPDATRGGRIVDAEGREVLLRGVNVNALAEYWQGSELPTVFPLAAGDPELMASIGWSTVRLLLSWSRVEPAPGAYDDAYLGAVRDTARRLTQHGLYVILDLHQDAWGATLVARPDEVCAAGSSPALGWDGAPGWASLDDDKPRCAQAGVRELSPAVQAAFTNFFADAPGPGGVGVRQRYARMLGHLAAFFAAEPGIAGYDVMNEPNAFDATQRSGLGALYGEALAEIRAGETAGGGSPRLVLFEPSALFSLLGNGGAPPFAFDRDVVYAPHLYAGSISIVPLDAAAFQVARDEALPFGGAPVLSGEWGGDPGRAADPNDPYFLAHQGLQDDFAFSATLWTWRESCGDPHKIGDRRAGNVPTVWGEFEVDCSNGNDVVGLRQPLIDQLTRAYVRAAPGHLEVTSFDFASGAFSAEGSGAGAGVEVLAFYPAARYGAPRLFGAGLEVLRALPAPGGNIYIVGRAVGGDWTLAAGVPE